MLRVEIPTDPTDVYVILDIRAMDKYVPVSVFFFFNSFVAYSKRRTETILTGAKMIFRNTS